ncbi:dTDP-glucose 4,6-dehydratase [Tsuneonella deserti]|uniref:dTDP-glucose 4,6-dehydratase n=1 Tax=Tsuneonella deserti TaxID=2035528 RepID=A0ABQ1S2J8_9SPHN|nr:alkaline phosphatase PhoX [Tsuneonella deserti]GGD88479.1 dTDP-glucose 4,6-dehydratase [Tsuneonella deserti]
MTMPMHRRSFLGATASAFAALAASGCSTMQHRASTGYGPLVTDPAGLVDLPAGFTYRVISQLGDTMSDGFTVPDAADGMGCFDLGGGKIALVRNHELMPGKDGGGVMGPAFDTMARSLVPLPGGTTTIVLDARTLAVEKQYRSLAGTIRNCAGGTTPWGSWLTCEEAPMRAGGAINRDHGWVFEVPARAPGLVDPVPLKAMGRFNHEAACVDPRTGYVYQTEDRDDGLLYRFIPKVPGKLAEGGKLQALAFTDGVGDTRNWGGVSVAPQSWRAVRWIDLTDVEAPEDDLRKRGAASGAALFARGEGIHMGEGELYFCCTSGGTAKLGQVFRLDTAGEDRGGGKLQLFFESTSPDQFNFGDNLTIAPWGDLVVCEDQYTDVVTNHLRGITPEGVAYPLALLHQQTEWAGACFAPDGRTLFVNAYHPAKTLAITGPWI